MLVTEQLETLTLATLKKHLREIREQKARPVCSMQQKDKLSTAWLLALPGAQSSLTSPIFKEGMAMVLCVPSSLQGENRREDWQWQGGPVGRHSEVSTLTRRKLDDQA